MLVAGFSEAIEIALSTILDPLGFTLLLVGTTFGLILGLLPGLGGIVALTLLIPLTFGLDATVAFVMLTAAVGGTNFAGSITAILVNTPGTAPNAASLLDGHPMAENGQAGEAIGASATASALGAIFGTLILAASVPIMIEIVILFGAREIFLLGVWGVTIIATVVGEDTLAGLISGLLGFLLAMHGSNIVTSTYRWTFGATYLQGGIPLLPMILGLFAVTEMIKLISEGEAVAGDASIKELGGGKWRGVMSVYRHRWIFLRSAAMGTFIGAVPGVGSMVATFLAYSQAVATAEDPDSFGHGDIRGVIAPEAANDSKDGGGFIPTLALGIPGSSSMAVIFGAFILHGIPPGPLLMQNHLDIVVIIILSLLFSNILTSVIGLTVTKQLTRVSTINGYILAPIVLVLSYFGAIVSSGVFVNVVLTLGFGILGFVMYKINMSPIPLLLGFILEPIIEKSFFQALAFSKGDPATFVGSPVAILLIVLIVLSLLLPYLRTYVPALGGDWDA